MRVENRFVEAKINAGWLGGSAANKMQQVIERQYPDWLVINAVPNYVNPVRRLIFLLLATISLGLYVPTAGYVVILRKELS